MLMLSHLFLCMLPYVNYDGFRPRYCHVILRVHECNGLSHIAERKKNSFHNWQLLVYIYPIVSKCSKGTHDRGNGRVRLHQKAQSCYASICINIKKTFRERCYSNIQFKNTDTITTIPIRVSIIIIDNIRNNRIIWYSREWGCVVARWSAPSPAGGTFRHPAGGPNPHDQWDRAAPSSSVASQLTCSLTMNAQHVYFCLRSVAKCT